MQRENCEFSYLFKENDLFVQVVLLYGLGYASVDWQN